MPNPHPKTFNFDSAVQPSAKFYEPMAALPHSSSNSTRTARWTLAWTTTSPGMLLRGCTTMDQQNHKETSLDF